MFSHTKILSIFVLPNSFFSSVNHRICIRNNNLGVVFLYSYGTAISGFGDSEEATLSLFLTKNKIFTNAKPSKSFSTREQQYLTANAQPSDSGHFKNFSKKIATSEKCCTFAPSHSFNIGANPFRFYLIGYKRSGVVYFRSNSSAVSECDNFGSITLSLFVNFLKFFTNVTLGKKFNCSRSTVFSSRRKPSDTRANLHLRRFNLYFRKAQRQIFSGFHSERRHQYCFGHRQEKSIFRSCCLFSRCLSDLIRTFEPKWDYHYFSRRASFSLELINFNYNAIPTSYFFGVVWGFFT
ncbi:hypothetical protein B739_1680 [Riemerella anatipestifer RA-CH-1]|uniref:Uncharacterized protein n=1 Tax=Riemerella anatipestifer RA-CH-1 TaxID=1228997 RepID=J9QTP4_RIEAN|nr:hypothetical protein B739_1680 [Riemerella anatipestifer RA-CH-1]